MFHAFLTHWCNIRSSARLVPAIRTWKLKHEIWIPQERLQVQPKIYCAWQGRHQRDKTQMVLVIVLKWDNLSLRSSTMQSHADGMHWKVRNTKWPESQRTSQIPRSHKNTRMLRRAYTHNTPIVLVWNILHFRASSQELNGARDFAAKVCQGDWGDQ